SRARSFRPTRSRTWRMSLAEHVDEQFGGIHGLRDHARLEEEVVGGGPLVQVLAQHLVADEVEGALEHGLVHLRRLLGLGSRLVQRLECRIWIGLWRFEALANAVHE